MRGFFWHTAFGTMQRTDKFGKINYSFGLILSERMLVKLNGKKFAECCMLENFFLAHKA